MCESDPAVAARTAVHVAASLRVGIGAHATTTALGHAIDPEGDLLVALSARQVTTLAMSVAGRPGEMVPGTAVAVDLAPVPLADRVRRTVTMHGPLVVLTGAARSAARRLVRAREAQADPLVWDADASVLRLEVTAITTAAPCWCPDRPAGDVAVSVDVADYLAAKPDPLAEVEGEWLRHLADDHHEVLEAIAMLTAPWLDRVSMEVRPLAIDRTGLRLRVRTATVARDLHVGFDQPVACPCEANRAINDLIERARPTVA